LKDEYRCKTAYKDGGFPLVDPEIIGNFRSAFKAIIA
jgi:hypothetical protein